jgi:hypothetical protein
MISKSTWKFIFELFLAAILWLMFVYISYVFVSMTINPFKWGTIGRLYFILVGVFPPVIFITMLVLNELLDETKSK